MATTKKLRYSPSEDQQTASWDAAADPDYDEAAQASFDEGADPDYDVGADPDYDDVVQVDYDDCGQPDYDEAAQVAYDDEPAAAATPAPPASPPPPAGFTYALGRVVRPATQQQGHPVVWQGYLLERHPVTGLRQRVPVYQLGDNFWDCYREDELRVA